MPTVDAGSAPMGGTGGAAMSTSDAAAGASDTGAGGASGGPKFTGSTVAKIMVLGSSNETRTCWRAFLWQKLRAAGVMNFDYVGRTVVGPDCGVMGYDKDVEAAPGTIITGFTASDFATRYKANPPDIVLVHVGGADAREGIAISKILGAYTLAVEQARLVNPHVAFLVGAHTPQQPMTGILELNAAIPIWAAKISTPDSPVGSVDLFTGIVSATDLSDGTHLNEAGSTKVADRFLAPLLPFFKP
jgi:acyl-CoA thioesterase-1